MTSGEQSHDFTPPRVKQKTQKYVYGKKIHEKDSAAIWKVFWPLLTSIVTLGDSMLEVKYYLISFSR